MHRLAAVAALAVVAMAACGDDDDGDSGEAAPAADLTVTVRAEGPDGPARTRQIECEELGRDASGRTCQRLAGLSVEQLAPVPRDTACTQIYGGPAVARVEGELHGHRVDARFERSDGCEIERWDRNRVLLGDVPGPP